METSNNNSWLQLYTTESISDVLTFDQFVMFEGVLSIARAVISICGIFGNAINIMTFISMGIKDGFSLSMTLLAGIELFHVIVIFMRSVIFGFFIIEYSTQFITWFPVEPFGLYFYIGHAARLLYSMTVLMTAFLSFARCMCVSRPLHFKSMFTVSNSIWVISLFSTISVGSYIPLIMTMTFTLQFDPRVNSTRFIFWVAPGREQARVWTWIVRNATLPISTLVVIVCCVFHMSKHLLISYRFRLQQQSLNLTDHSPDRNTLATNLNDHSPDRNTLAFDAKKTTKLAVKERRVIQQMVIMSVVVIACDVPEIVISFTSILVPSFGLLKPLNNIYLVVIGVNHMFQVVNSSVNVAIYWKYSSRYRAHCCLAQRSALSA
ncbi:fMet-Leu-Phe receptor [Biomphalaria pfeifferi]|uniref:fMet-Leu-Phe receptor n=1 Tax=Biomphalaria pfeifferi TaxID=112525 RepID=A0AAD8BFB9_BIOPF|nr:fMet-Leu-Phe receptor [Biomphalaria pfeifferi]